MENNIEVPNVVDVEWAKEEMKRTGKKRCNKDFVYYRNTNKGLKYIDLSTVRIKNTRSVDWESVNNYITVYMYGKQYQVFIKFYNKKRTKSGTVTSYLKIKYENKEVVRASSDLLAVQLDGLFNYITSDFKYDVGSVVGDCVIIQQIRDGSKKYRLYCPWARETFIREEKTLQKTPNSPFKTGHSVCKRNSFYFNNPEKIEYLKDKNDAYKYTTGSGKYIECKCPNCGKEKKLVVKVLLNNEFSCPSCSNNISIGERLLSIILNDNNIEYEHQKWFDDCRNNNGNPYYYDFYLPKQHKIIEVHGEQHYSVSKTSRWKTLEENKKNDNLKKQYCLSHDIDYSVIDARNSDLLFILNSIKKELPYNIRFKSKEYYKDKLQDSKVIPFFNEIVKKYSEGYSIKGLSRYYSISEHKVVSIAKRAGVYTKRDKSFQGVKKVRCISTGKVFNSIKEAIRFYDLPEGCKIGMVCSGKRKSAGGYSWEYVDNE